MLDLHSRKRKAESGFLVICFLLSARGSNSTLRTRQSVTRASHDLVRDGIDRGYGHHPIDNKYAAHPAVT